MKEVYLNVVTDEDGNLVDEYSKRILSQFPNSIPSMPNKKIIRADRHLIKCFLLSSGHGLAVQIAD